MFAASTATTKTAMAESALIRAALGLAEFVIDEKSLPKSALAIVN